MTRPFLFLLIAAVIAGCSSPNSPTVSSNSGGLVLVPHLIDFGSVPNGQTRDTMIELFNDGVDSITITGDGVSSSAVVDTNFTHPVTLAPDDTRWMEVEFTPSELFGIATDTMHYQSSTDRQQATNYIGLLTLKATVTSGGNGGSGNLYVPSEIDFGSLPIGAWHDTTVAITNNGSAPITILSSSVNSIEAQDTNFRNPVTLNSGGFLLVHLEFDPNQSGARSAADTIHYTSAGTMHTATIVLTATGVTTSNTPGPGSTFSFTVDTNGVHLSQLSTYTIVSNSLFYQGKANVVEVRDDTGGIQYYHLESNGDLSVFVDLNAQSALPIPLPAAWLTIPLGSKQTTSSVLYDTTIQYQGFPVAIQIVDTGKYNGPAQVTAANKTFATDQGSLAVSLSANAFGVPVASSETTVNIWYAKQLAFYPKRRDVTATNGTVLGQPSGTTTTNYVLASYSIK